MDVYNKAKRFNEQFKLGCLLLVLDAFGGTFVDKLTQPARVLDEEAFIYLEHTRHIVNIDQVISKAVNQDTSDLARSLSEPEQRLIKSLGQRAKRYRQRIEDFELSIQRLTLRKQYALQNLPEGSKLTAILKQQEKLICQYECLVTEAEIQENLIADTLKALRIEKSSRLRLM